MTLALCSYRNPPKRGKRTTPQEKQRKYVGYP